MVARIIPRALCRNLMGAVESKMFASEGVTIAATFVGESYMAAGLFGVILAAFLVGLLARWWTRKAFSAESAFGILIYGSGFFAVVITMRSMYWLPVAVLPTLAAAILGHSLLRTQAVRGPLLPRHP
jgi:hypothetical protein